jgi:hypothetical protein
MENRGTGFDSLQEKEIFLFSILSNITLGPTQSPIQWVPGLKQPGHVANRSPASSAEVKNCGPIPPFPYASS